MVTKVSTPMIAGGPAFSVYRNTDQGSVSTGVWTKVQLNAENFDTDSAFDSSTNYRFTPTVAGYYQINGNISVAAGTALTNCSIAIYKNGAASAGDGIVVSGTTATMSVSDLVYLNGSTDYIELYGYATGTGALSFTGSVAYATKMSGCLVRT